MSKNHQVTKKKFSRCCWYRLAFGGLLAQFSPMKSGGFQVGLMIHMLKASAESSKKKNQHQLKLRKKSNL